MKLGIVVVYLVAEEDERLLDLHLYQIEKCTQVPYEIYASCERLSPELQEKLEQHPKVRICECPKTSLRLGEEHSFYQEHLVKIAIENGSTHIAALHVDSFPVRSGWAREMAGKLSESCVLAAVMREENGDLKPHSTCLLFHRDFYLKYHPTFELSKAEVSSQKYKQYLHEFKHVADSGVGYGFKVYSEGFSWYSLLRSNKNEEHHLFGVIYGDLIFHLGAASQKYKLSRADVLHINASKAKSPLNFLLFIGSILFPSRVKEIALSILPKWFMGPYAHAAVVNEDFYESARKQLLENPDSYLNYLRTGPRSRKDI